MLFFLAFHFSLALTPNCRNWSPNYSVLVLASFKESVFFDRIGGFCDWVPFARLYSYVIMPPSGSGPWILPPLWAAVAALGPPLATLVPTLGWLPRPSGKVKSMVPRSGVA
jgi:hypothetical protein